LAFPDFFLAKFSTRGPLPRRQLIGHSDARSVSFRVRLSERYPICAFSIGQSLSPLLPPARRQQATFLSVKTRGLSSFCFAEVAPRDRALPAPSVSAAPLSSLTTLSVFPPSLCRRLRFTGAEFRLPDTFLQLLPFPL